MAAARASNNELYDISKFNLLTLKEKYKIAVEWTDEDWVRYNLMNSKLKRLINSTKFWKIKLKEALGDTNVILTLFSEASGGFLSPQYIVDYIVEQFPGVVVDSYNRFRNPRYLNVDFENAAMRDLVFDNFNNIGNFEVGYLIWAPLSTNLSLRVHWLPKKVPISKIASSLNTYFEHRFVRHELAVHPTGKAYGCGVATFVGKLKFGVTMDKVPHILQIGGLDALLTIPTRLPLCLQCDRVGHKANECRLSYCSTCRSKKPKEHECVVNAATTKTYAQSLKMPVDDSIEEEDFVFENTDYVSPEEYYRVEAHNRNKTRPENGEEPKESGRKFLKAIPPLAKTTRNAPADAEYITKEEGVVSKQDITLKTNQSETSSTGEENVEMTPIKEDTNEEDGYIKVVKKNKAVKVKESQNKEKGAKNNTPLITYGTKSNKHNTRSSMLFDQIVASPEGVLTLKDSLSTEP